MQWRLIRSGSFLGMSLLLVCSGSHVPGEARHVLAADRDVAADQNNEASPPQQKPSTRAKGSKVAVGMPALKKATRSGKYAFLFFYKTKDEQTQSMRTVFDKTLKGLTQRAMPIVVDISRTEEHEIVERFGLDWAPMPLVLVVAPSGAIPGGFPTRFSKEDLENAFATPKEAQCLKELQAGKLTLLCIQNKKTKANRKAMQGVRDFLADPRFQEGVTLVRLDPADAAEKAFLKRLRLPENISTALTVVLTPPGTILATFEGETSKDLLISSLQQGCPSCCPGGTCFPPEEEAETEAPPPEDQ